MSLSATPSGPRYAHSKIAPGIFCEPLFRFHVPPGPEYNKASDFRERPCYFPIWSGREDLNLRPPAPHADQSLITLCRYLPDSGRPLQELQDRA